MTRAKSRTSRAFSSSSWKTPITNSHPGPANNPPPTKSPPRWRISSTDPKTISRNTSRALAWRTSKNSGKGLSCSCRNPLRVCSDKGNRWMKTTQWWKSWGTLWREKRFSSETFVFSKTGFSTTWNTVRNPGTKMTSQRTSRKSPFCQDTCSPSLSSNKQPKYSLPFNLFSRRKDSNSSSKRRTTRSRVKDFSTLNRRISRIRESLFARKKQWSLPKGKSVPIALSRRKVKTRLFWRSWKTSPSSKPSKG